MKRREFLLAGMSGAVALAVPLSTLIANKHNIYTEKSNEIFSAYRHYKIIYDKGFIQAREFAKKAEKYGLPTAAIDRDITDLWYNDLRVQWKREPTWVAGITSTTSLFLLGQMARDEKHNIVRQRTIDNDLSLWVIGPIT